MKSNSKIFTRNAIRIGTIMGSPIVAGYMMYVNYIKFGKRRAANQALIIGVVSTALILAFLFSLSNNIIDQIPPFLFPLIYLAVVDFIVNKFQQDDIDEFLKKNGEKKSNWEVTGISIFGTIFTLAVGALLIFNLPLYEGKVKSFGSQNHHIYFSKNVDPSLTDSLAFSLAKIRYFTNQEQGTAYIGRRDEFYVVTLPLQKSGWNDQGVLSGLQALKNELRRKFRTKWVIIRLHHYGFSKDDYKEL
jgi:hypothetical protein